MKLLVIFCVAALSGIHGDLYGPDKNELTESFHWDILDYEISPNQRKQAIATGSYIPNKNAILTARPWQDKMFVAVFRTTPGVLSSLNYFSLNTTEKSPILHPYPSLEANYVNEDPANQTVSLVSQSSIINSGHFDIDKCNRLWIIDGGYTDHFGGKRVIAPPAIVIFDLTTDTLIRRIDIPQKFINPLSTFARIAVDYDGENCDDVHAYVADLFRSIIVYSFKKDRVWQVEHNFMGSDPQEGNFIYKDINFQWNYGICALAIGDKQPDGSKRVYFASLSSTKIYYVSNQVLQDETYTLSKYYYDFKMLGDSGKGWQANQMAYDDKTGAFFNTIFAGATIGCWNTRLPFQSLSTVHKTSTEFFPMGINIDSDRNLWVISHLIPFSTYQEFQPGKKNVRIFKEPIDQAIAGTNCKPKK